MKHWAALALAFLLCTSCRTQLVTVERVRVDSVYVGREYRDSIYLRDSISVRDEERNDTVIRYVERWRTHYKEIVRTDTCERVRVDSIPYPVRVEVVKYKRPKVFWYFIILVSVIGLVLVAARLRR